MPDDIQTPTTPPGCAPTTGSEVPTPRTNAARLTIEAGDWRTEKDCTNYALDLARQLEREVVALAESHRTLLHEAMEMSDELGHSNVETTIGYCHAEACSVPSPLEILPA